MEQPIADNHGHIEIFVRTEITAKMHFRLMENIRNACENFGIKATVRNTVTNEEVKTRN